jgi:hypothetical protein
LGTLDYQLAETVPFKLDGTVIGLDNLMAVGASGTKLVVTGDFAAARDIDGALDKTMVFMAANAAACLTGAGAVASDTLTATTATFRVGNTATSAKPQLCYTVNGTTGVPAKVYSAVLNAVALDDTVYAVSNITGLAAGEIVHDGSETVALNVTSPDNVDVTYLRVNNVSTTAHGPVTAKLIGQDGVEIGNGTLVSDLTAGATSVFSSQQIADIMNVTSWTGRAKLYITAEIPAGSLRVQNLIRTNNVLTNMGGDTSTNKN